MNPIRLFLGSFYSPQTYREARAPQPGMHLFYSFLLVLLTSAAMVIAGMSFLHRMLLDPRDGHPAALDQFIATQAVQIPVMTLQNGTLNVTAKQPYALHIAMPHQAGSANPSDAKKNDYVWAVIDTTGATTLHNMTAPMLVTAHEVIIKSDRDIRVYTFDKLGQKSSAPLIINRALVEDGARRIIAWLHENRWKIGLLLAIPAWIMFALVAYLLRLIMLMALGLVGVILSRIFNMAMDFATSVRVAAVAYTPVAVMATAAMCFTARALPAWALLALGSWMMLATLIASRRAE